MNPSSLDINVLVFGMLCETKKHIIKKIFRFNFKYNTKSIHVHMFTNNDNDDYKSLFSPPSPVFKDCLLYSISFTKHKCDNFSSYENYFCLIQTYTYYVSSKGKYKTYQTSDKSITINDCI